jgi:hypothetical protein
MMWKDVNLFEKGREAWDIPLTSFLCNLKGKN